MESSVLTIAYIYATAVFDVAVSQKNIDTWQKSLSIFSKIIENTLMKSLCFRCLAPKKLSEIFLKICEDYQKKKMDIFSKNLIYIISENNRLLLLPVIFKEFLRLRYIYENSIRIKIITAWPLNSYQLKKINKIMSKRLSKSVNLENIVDKQILSGIVIQIGDTIIDNSVRNRIFRLNHILQF
ncbi:F0F1 ATP synthase subunit delta [Candidatus Blochmannia ocreatus (nom. nud.)]|uniref:ATP synthase subunit delta n=1 Tax=Candidatus Blochmannia ocreatus (nom. nud.) TaxID=251538 RepID=A0ABY4SSZ0_9ENTR|nr:F0F1 ATP synthase subunit delta [Candidatus Blochmannia ocreatus]URJ25101.1 F0F1 ATP synthase subunit delta [Candidatus Blochmannia ocreatus]